MITENNSVKEFKAGLDALQLETASAFLTQDEGEELLKEMCTVGRASPNRLFQERATMELVLRISESLIYRGRAKDAHELLLPYTEKPEKFIEESRSIRMRWRLQVGECLYSQRNQSTNYLPLAELVAKGLFNSCWEQDKKFEEGQVHYFSMRLEHRKGNYDSMGTYAMKAVDAITQSDTQTSNSLGRTKHVIEAPWWLARILLEYGISAWKHGESERAAARLQLAKWLLREITGDTLNHARLDHSIGSLYHAQGETGEAWGLLNRAKERYEHLGHKLNMSRIRCALGRYRLSEGKKEAQEHFEKAMKYAEEFGSDIQQAEVHVWQGWRRCEQEVSVPELNEAIKEGVKALGLLESTPAYHIYVDAHLMMGHCYLKMDGTGKAKAHFEKALLAARQHRLKKHVLNALLSLGEVARAQNDIRGALGHYQDAMQGFPDGKLPFSKYLDRKSETLKAWLFSNDLEVFMRTAEGVQGETKKTLEDYHLELDRWLVKQIYEAEGEHVGAAAKRLGITRQRVSQILVDSKARQRRGYRSKEADMDKKHRSQKKGRRRGK